MLVYEGGEAVTEALRSYLLSVIAAALLSAVGLSLLPKGSVRRVLGLCCGMLLALCVLRPVLGLDEAALSQSLARFQMQAEEARTGIEVKNRELVAAIIKQSTQTYILDKASALGLEADVEVTVELETAYPYPSAVTVTCEAAAAQKLALQTYIIENFAIPAERQTWKTGAEQTE